MVVLKNTDCYMWRITDDERSSIHTDTGLRAVEVSCQCYIPVYFNNEPRLEKTGNSPMRKQRRRSASQ